MSTKDIPENNEPAPLLGLGSSEQLGLAPERAAFERWLNPGQHAGNVSPWVEPGRYEKDTHNLAWLAWRAARAAERESIKARLLAMDDAAAGRHNYYAHAAWVLFDRKA